MRELAMFKRVPTKRHPELAQLPACRGSSLQPPVLTLAAAVCAAVRIGSVEWKRALDSDGSDAGSPPPALIFKERQSNLRGNKCVPAA